MGYWPISDRTFAQWQTATFAGLDLHSINVAPVFLSTTDLHLNTSANDAINNLGIPLATVTTDIDGDERDAANPDMGADEFVSTSCAGVVGGTASGTATFCGSGTPSITASGYSSISGSTYQWQYSYDNFASTNDVSGQIDPAFLITGLVSATTWYRLKVSCPIASVTVYSNVVTITINPSPAAVSITPSSATVCPENIQSLVASGGQVASSNMYIFGTQVNQNTAIINATDYPAPYSIYFGGQRMQMLIRASELTAAGFSSGSTITSIQFPVVSKGSGWGTSVNSCGSFQVSIRNTPLTTLAAFQSGLTQVVAPANFTPTVGYTNTHSFSTPFAWDGTSNIIIETTFSNNITGDVPEAVIQYNSPTSYQSTIVYRADGQTPAAVAAATTVTYSYSARPDFKLNGLSLTAGSITWSPDTDLYTNAGATIPYTIGSISNTVYSAPTGPRTYTATATSTVGCTSSTNVSVTLGDIQAPTALCKDIIVQLDATGHASVTAAMVNNGSIDNCGIASMTVSPNNFTCADVSPTPVFTDLIISEYVEGSSNNKYIELYNGTSSSINLANYELQCYVNGSPTSSFTNALSGTLAPGATIVYKNSAAAIYPGTATPLTSVVFNGNDAIALYKTTTASYVDIFGVIGDDPVTAWTLSGNTTVDKTLRRKPTVTTGVTSNPTGTGPAAFSTLFSEWDMFPIDNVSGLGSHAANSVGTPVVLTVTDIYGNASTCTSHVAVFDNIAPTALCHDITVSLDGTGQCTITPAMVDNGSGDNCSFAMSVNPNTFTCDNLVTPIPADLLITEYVEGSANNKYIEIYNGTGAPVNLANYQLRLYTNGAPVGSPTNNTILAGTLNNGSTIVYKNTLATIFSDTSSTNASVNFNGDDAVALYKIAPAGFIDIFGVIGNDPGTAWTGTGGYTTLNKTLRRKPTVTSGVTTNPSGTGPGAFSTLTTQWDMYNIDDVTGLGSHSNSSGSITPVILTVTDANGNVSACTANVTIQDNTLPSIVCPSSPPVVCVAGAYTHTGLGWDATATDNCSVASVTYSLSGATTGSGTTLNGTVFNQGVTTVTWTATDVNGKFSTCFFNVTVKTPPTAAICCNANIRPGFPASISVAFTGTAPWSFTYNANGSNPVTLTNIYDNPYTFTVNPIITTTYLITAVSDAGGCGGTFTGSATITTGPVEVQGSVGLTDMWYPTLKAAFDDINLGTHTGSIDVLIHGSTTETASAVLNASGTGSSFYSDITISPTVTGVSVSGSAGLTNQMIILDGADNVTFDGRFGGVADLILQSIGTSPTSATMMFINSAENNTVKYCKIKGAGFDLASGVIHFSTSVSGNGNDNNVIDHCEITNSGSRPRNVIFSEGTAGNKNSTNTLSNNLVYDFFNPTASSYGIQIGNNSDNWTISDNSFYETAPFTSSNTGTGTYSVIFISSSTTNNQFTVSGNSIGGNGPLCSGTWEQTNVNIIFYGIFFDVPSSTTSVIRANTIKNFIWTNTGGGEFWTGISVVNGVITIGGPAGTDGNIIGNSAIQGSIVVEAGEPDAIVYGIHCQPNPDSLEVVTIKNNSIGGITAKNTFSSNSTRLYGIFVFNDEGVDSVVVRNNLVGSNTLANSMIASSPSTGADFIQEVIGISVDYTGSIFIHDNTVANIVNSSVNSFSRINGILASSAGVVNSIRGNVIHDISNAGGTANYFQSSVIGLNIPFVPFFNYNHIYENTIYNIFCTHLTDKTNVMGFFYNSNGSTGLVEKNFIHSLMSSSSAPNSVVAGIYLQSPTAAFRNNIISINVSASASFGGKFYGFYIPNGPNNLYHNTFSLTGTRAAGIEDYALYSNVNGGDVISNIFNNASKGSGTHYSVKFINCLGTIDYNDYVGEISSTVPTGANSRQRDPLFPPPAGPDLAVTDFIPKADTLVGDTNLLAVITHDIDSTLRCMPTMGAQENDTLVVMYGFVKGLTSTRCQGAETILYTATAAHARRMTYSLDAASLAGGNIIDEETGAVTYVATWAGITIITAKAEGCREPQYATHTVTTSPSVQGFTPPDNQSFCVEYIADAVYYDPGMDISPERPEYYTFIKGNTALDILSVQSCCITPDTIHWRIDFVNTPQPTLPPCTGPLIPTTSIDSIGQPSLHSNFNLPGDGCFFTDVEHTITYWTVDCNGKQTTPVSRKIIIKPRPNVIKN